MKYNLVESLDGTNSDYKVTGGDNTLLIKIFSQKHIFYVVKIWVVFTNNIQT